MAKKSGQVALQEEINNNEDWEKLLEKTGLYVVEIYTEWCGPCIPMIANLKKIKLELGGDNLHYGIAKSDTIDHLARFRNKSEPHWMILYDGCLVNLIIDTNAPKLMKLIAIEFENYNKFKKGEIQPTFIPFNQITEEENRKMVDKNQYYEQIFKEEKRIRAERMVKIREHAIKKFVPNIQKQTCVIFFPHTIKYVMVEKSPEDGMETLDEPIMHEQRICDLATVCARKFEELIVIDAKEVQLTEDTLNEIFFLDLQILQSYPQELIDQILSNKVYSIMISSPTVVYENEEDETDIEPPDIMGVIESRMSLIIYGEGGALNPSPNSIAAQNKALTEEGVILPSLYTPINPMSKTAALTVLFRKYCETNGYIPPQSPAPQFLVIFDITKSNIVLPIVEDLEDKILNYGFFRSADPENPKLLCKDPELLASYGMDRVGKDAKLVISVLKDDKDKYLLRFVDVGPVYVSSDENIGIDDAIKFFPHDFEEMDGEIKLWLARETREENAQAENFSDYEEEIDNEYNEEIKAEENSMMI
ncbi:thioredoxin domain-containing protein 3-like isoform X2 [Daktulosphaira vitifoliae]|nr:thioredoxin domain-containing protein 3-like isoform X2 [Daktulosphaira vitifoliae]XP_050526778.1 thioredoxin domain-containing protein 3-like isoform X2 [Daktulosphaira vitifoliae]